MSKRKYRSALVMMMALVLLVAACSSSNSADPTPSTTPGTEQADTPAPTSDDKGAAPDPFGKYSPAIELSTVRGIDTSTVFAAGESLDNNIWTPIMEDELGIKIKNLWVVDNSQFDQKLNVTLSSGDLPDFMAVNKVTMQRLIESGLAEDLTDAFNDYASDYAKEVMAVDGGAAMKSATVNGKLMALPITNVGGGVVSTHVLWVRTDWLKKLDLPEPKTMDDVYAIAAAFAKDDPDGNGKPDTVGLAVNNNNETYQAFGTLHSVFNGYHAYPTFWVKDADDNLVYGGIQPEMKEPLEKLQQMYKDGIIDKEFSVKSWQKLGEDAAAGKLGMGFGKFSDATVFLKDNRANDPEADWKAFPIVSVDDQPALPEADPTAVSYYVVKKGIEHPEAVVKLFNLYLEKYYQTDYSGTKNPFILDAETGIQAQKYFPVLIDPVDVNINAHLQVMAELNNNGDGSALGFPASIHFERISKFRQGDDTMWFSERTFGAGGAFAVFAKYQEEGTYQFNAYTGPPTPTMVEKNATLEKMQKEIITKIVMGDAPVSDYDKFISQWKIAGGDEITKEVNAYYQQNK